MVLVTRYGNRCGQYFFFYFQHIFVPLRLPVSLVTASHTWEAKTSARRQEGLRKFWLPALLAFDTVDDIQTQSLEDFGQGLYFELSQVSVWLEPHTTIEKISNISAG